MSKFRKLATTGLIATTLFAAVRANPRLGLARVAGLVRRGRLGHARHRRLGRAHARQGRHLWLSPSLRHPYPVRYRVAQSPVYDGWGAFIGYRRMRVVC